ncbi:hypothetical protein Bbelb_029310 [Branchiostoma belcheri]|nr:hypothetical protein Bbelb_029310 [Branchiostoma belcheri]
MESFSSLGGFPRVAKTTARPDQTERRHALNIRHAPPTGRAAKDFKGPSIKKFAALVLTTSARPPPPNIVRSPRINGQLPTHPPMAGAAAPNSFSTPWGRNSEPLPLPWEDVAHLATPLFIREWYGPMTARTARDYGAAPGPYLGIILSHDLKWLHHIDSIISKANSTLGFLKHNIRGASQELDPGWSMQLQSGTHSNANTHKQTHYRSNSKQFRGAQPDGFTTTTDTLPVPHNSFTTWAGQHYNPTYEDHYQAGKTALKEGEFDRAENHFASALKLVHHQFSDPQTVSALRALGDVFHARVKNTFRPPATKGKEDPKPTEIKAASLEQEQECFEDKGKQIRGPNFQELSLGDLEQAGTWTVNAVALYNSAIVRSKQEEEVKEIQTSIRNIEELFLQCLVGGQNETHDSPRAKLLQIREECQKKLDDLDTIPYNTEHELDRAEAVRSIYKQVAADITGLIQSMVEASIEDLGEPPCRFAVIGLGSLAREETTPYSDFEFAILLEEGGDSRENRQYFRNLTRLLHLKVIDLGETILPAVAIKSLNDFYSGGPESDWFYDTGPRGFAFDGAMPGASKTPLGRPEFCGKPELELIRTPNNMAILQTTASAETYGFNIDVVLRTVAHVAGDRKLVEEYKVLVQQTLNTKNPSAHNKPASEISSNEEESANIGYQTSQVDPEVQTLRCERAMALLKKILQSFKTTLKEDEDGKLFQVKNEIYRLPSMVISGLGLFYALEAKTAWDIIEEMADKGLLSKVASQNLKVVVSIATELRLRTYLSNNSQSDNITPMKRIDHGTDEVVTEETSASRVVRELTDVLPKSTLVRFYQTMLPLEETISAVLKKKAGEDKDLTERSLTEGCLLDTSTRTKSLILLRLSQYQEAISLLEKEIKHPETAQPPLGMTHHLGACHYNLGNAYRGDGDQHKAMEHYQEALELWRKDAQGADEHIAMALHALGHINHMFDKFDQALEAYGEALEFRKQLYRKDGSGREFISHTLHGMASVYRDVGDYDKALKLEKQALESAQEMHGLHRSHSETATFISGLGIIHREMANFKEARKCFQEALRMFKSVVGENVAHPQIAGQLTDLANLDKQSQWSNLDCVSKYFQALQIFRILYGTEGKTYEIAGILGSIANCLDDLGHLQDAEKYHRDSLDMFLHIYGRADNTRVAGAYNDLGSSLLEAGRNEEGLEMMEKALQMRQAVFQGKGREAPELVSSISNLGYAHWKLGNNDKATQYTEEAIAMATSLHKARKLHPSIIVPMKTLGAVYMDRKEWVPARELFEKVLEMEQTLYSTRDRDGSVSVNVIQHQGQGWQCQCECHSAPGSGMAVGPNPLKAMTLSNLGSVHGEMLDHNTALQYLQRAEKISEDVFGEGTPHPQVALIWNNMGMTYKDMGNIPKALEYLTRSLQMRVAIFGEDNPHPDIGTSLGNMGILMAKLGNIDMAATCFEKALKKFRGSYGNRNHPSIAGTLDNLGIIFYEKGDYHESLKHHREALEMKQELYGGKPNVSIALTLFNLANTYKALREHDTALGLFQQSLDIYEGVHGKGALHPDIALGLVGIGNQYVNLKRCQDGIKLLQKALAMLEAFYGADTPHPDIAACVNNIAFAHDELEEYDSAVQCYQRALEVWRQLFGNEHPNVAMALNNLASAYTKLGDTTSAMVHFEEAVKIYQMSPCNPQAHQAFFNLAKVCLHQGNKMKALANYVQGINALQLLPGPVSLRPELLTGLDSAAQILFDGKSYKAAAEYWEKALAACSQMRQAPNVDIGKMQFNLARCYSELGDVEKEGSLHEQALQTRLQQHGEKSANIHVGLSLLHTAKALQKAGDHQLALLYLQQAAEIFQVLAELSPESKTFLAAMYKSMSDTYQSMGDQGSAVKYLSEMMRTLQSTNQEVDDSVFDGLSTETKSLLEKFPGLRPSLKKAATTVKMLGSWRSAEDLNGAAPLMWSDLLLPRRTMSKPELQLFGHFLADIGAAQQFHSLIKYMEKSYEDVISAEVPVRCLMMIGELCVGLADSSALMCHRLVTAGMVEVLCGWLEKFRDQYPQDQNRSSLVTSAIHTIHNCCKVPEVRPALKQQNINKLLGPYLKVGEVSTRLVALLATSYLSDNDTPEADSDILDHIISKLEKALQEESRSSEGYSAMELIMGIGTLCGNTVNRTAFLERSAAALVEKLMEEGDEEETEAAANAICTLLAD